MSNDFSPREIVSELDKHIVGQQDAKRAVAIALRNRWRRQQVEPGCMFCLICWKRQPLGMGEARDDRAGMLLALDSGLDSTMTLIGLKAFPAALVGGLDSLVGALVGALSISSIEIGVIRFIDPLLADVVPFLVLIVMLVIRPWGLFGTREELDRV